MLNNLLLENIYMKPKICPFCEQDYIYRYFIEKTKEEVFLCPECDSLWFNQKDIGSPRGSNYEDAFNERGIEPTWDDELYQNILYE